MNNRIYLQGESKKSVICGAWYKIVPFFVQLSFRVFVSIFFENLYFFSTPMAQKNPRIFLWGGVESVWHQFSLDHWS